MASWNENTSVETLLINHVVVPRQGDGNIRYFEITTEKPYLQYLMEFRSPTPQKGLGKLSGSSSSAPCSPPETVAALLFSLCRCDAKARARGGSLRGLPLLQAHHHEGLDWAHFNDCAQKGEWGSQTNYLIWLCSLFRIFSTHLQVSVAAQCSFAFLTLALRSWTLAVRTNQ